MQRKTSADALVRADRSPMSDVSQAQQVGQQHHDDRSSIRSARSDGEFAGLDSRDRRQPHSRPVPRRPPLTVVLRHRASSRPSLRKARCRTGGEVALARWVRRRETRWGHRLRRLRNRRLRCANSQSTSFRELMGSTQCQPVWERRGATGWKRCCHAQRGPASTPPLSPALSPSSSTEASDYHATIEEWMRDDYSDRSPATTTFSATSPSPSSSSRDSPLPPLPKEEDEETFDSMPQASHFLPSPTVLVSSNEPTHNASQAPARHEKAAMRRRRQEGLRGWS